MPNQQDGFVLARAVQADDQVLLAIIGTAQEKILGRKSRNEEAPLHRLSCGRNTAYGIRAVDLDQLLKNVMRELPGSNIDLGVGGKRKKKEWDKQECGASFQIGLLEAK